ncbi:MAG TPA: transketolase [Alphaproteobacteria bacterium]|nr:transketolase [Alphaproteobacteria bacterium]MCB9984666.1 transketolase [Micavibrio sp.]HRK97998.1 transketolase [Alphaproteobacteria bacterium]
MNSTTATASQTSTSQEPDMREMANAIRFLAADAVDKANSGHPGMPMGMADVATVLYSKFLKFDPKNPTWADRDRFILSGGHGSMLLYAVNYLTGYDKITIEEIKRFRQLHSLTPGHPEVMQDAGIEMTTGPLGQGIATAVGFALAERMQASRFGADLVNHKTYVMCGDGDLMEGISHEACSFAGHMKLSNLIVLYDDNSISIDGDTSLSFTEDVLKRFESYGWATDRSDGHDFSSIESALSKAQGNDRPTLIACKTKIGFGAPNKQGTHGVHGSPLGSEETAAARANLGWTADPFEIPSDILHSWRSIGTRGQIECQAWKKRLESSSQKAEFEKSLVAKIDDVVTAALADCREAFAKDQPKLATRAASGKVLDCLVPKLPQLIGGSADLTPSNNTQTKSSAVISANSNYAGQYIHYGVREFAMCTVMNGLTLHGGFVPYGGTFLSFTDYCRPAIRLAALMKQRAIYVMTHDSIGLGEDGPTHQPVEHVPALRVIPNLLVLRPCDAIETLEAWEIALNNTTGPSVLVLTRQALPAQRQDATENKSARGAYILCAASAEPKAVLMATGSEVSLAITAQKELEAKGIPTQVVSIPSFELFAKQDAAYRASVLGSKSAIKVGCEAAIRQGWDSVIGNDGIFIGMTGFGESAPAEVLYQHFGITSDAIVEAVTNRI